MTDFAMPEPQAKPVRRRGPSVGLINGFWLDKDLDRLELEDRKTAYIMDSLKRVGLSDEEIAALLEMSDGELHDKSELFRSSGVFNEDGKLFKVKQKPRPKKGSKKRKKAPRAKKKKPQKAAPDSVAAQSDTPLLDAPSNTPLLGTSHDAPLLDAPLNTPLLDTSSDALLLSAPPTTAANPPASSISGTSQGAPLLSAPNDAPLLGASLETQKCGELLLGASYQTAANPLATSVSAQFAAALEEAPPPYVNVNVDVVVSSLKENENENGAPGKVGFRSQGPVPLLHETEEKSRQMCFGSPKEPPPAPAPAPQNTDKGRHREEFAQIICMIPQELRENKAKWKTELAKLQQKYLLRGFEYLRDTIEYVLEQKYKDFWGYVEGAFFKGYGAKTIRERREAEEAALELDRLEREKAEEAALELERLEREKAEEAERVARLKKERDDRKKMLISQYLSELSSSELEALRTDIYKLHPGTQALTHTMPRMFDSLVYQHVEAIIDGEKGG